MRAWCVQGEGGNIYLPINMEIFKSFNKQHGSPGVNLKSQPWLGQAQGPGGTEEEAVNTKEALGGRSGSSPFKGTRALSGLGGAVNQWKAASGAAGQDPARGAHRQPRTSEPLQPLLLPLSAHDKEQGRPQCGQGGRAADGEQLLHAVALTLRRLDGRDGT